MEKKKQDPTRCCKEVSTRRGWHWYQCSRKGVVEREGKKYCKQHDPDRVKNQRKKSELKYRVKSLKNGLLYSYAATGREAYRLFKKYGRISYPPELSEEIKVVEDALDEIKKAEQLLKEME